ncbi:MAG: cytochrome c [Ignavibacteria bacterium]|nr:cytochrome c [Ignavibacteria bacterium]
MKTVVSKLLVSIASASIVLGVVPACTVERESSDEGTERNEADVSKDEPSYFKIKNVDVSPKIDVKMATAGKEIFETKCGACHKYDERYVGPPLGKVTARRTPEYVMNMILFPETMQDNDDTVKALIQTFMLRMPNLNLQEQDARNVLEHLRDYAQKN